MLGHIMTTKTQQRRIFTVSRLNQEVQQTLESNFGTLWLQGELSNFSRPVSGHFYFTLKDSQSQIRCAMFRGQNRYVDFQPENGNEVLVRGKLGLYTARGDFQLIVAHMEEAGSGILQKAFEQRKQELNALGWFDDAAKKALPDVPQTIGVVTSTTGAAIRDVLQVLARRYPQANIVIYPTMVQGKAAAPSIVQAINTAVRRAEADVLLIVRGGGSLEDLWAFNEQSVATAVRECTIPVVSGVGHEVDITICDLIADLRAPTPSAAAEMATPDGMVLLGRAQQHNASLMRIMDTTIKKAKKEVGSLEQRLAARHPRRLINDRAQRIDELDNRLRKALIGVVQQNVLRLTRAESRLHTSSPAREIGHRQNQINTLSLKLENALKSSLSSAQNRWGLADRALSTVSPHATLNRGFAVVKSGTKIVRNAADLSPGDSIVTQLAQGEISSVVEKTK